MPWSTPTQALMVECLDGFVWSFLGPIIPIIPILALSCKNDTYIECYTPKSHFFWKNKTLKMTVKTPKSQFTWENHGKLLLYNYPKITIFLGKLWQILAQEKMVCLPRVFQTKHQGRAGQWIGAVLAHPVLQPGWDPKNFRMRIG